VSSTAIGNRTPDTRRRRLTASLLAVLALVMLTVFPLVHSLMAHDHAVGAHITALADHDEGHDWADGGHGVFSAELSAMAKAFDQILAVLQSGLIVLMVFAVARLFRTPRAGPDRPRPIRLRACHPRAPPAST